MVLIGTRKQCADCRVNSERTGKAEERKLLVEWGKVSVKAGEEAGARPREMGKAGPSSFLGVPQGSDTPAVIGGQIVSSGRRGRLSC